MTIADLFGTQWPIIQAPMAGAQGSAMAIAVSNAGALGSLPCAMLTPESMRAELAAIVAAIGGKPYNVNFFCHTPPAPNPGHETRWRAALAPYYAQFGIDPPTWVDPIVVLVKMLFFVFLFIWVRATLPRLRYDQLMSLGWKIFLPLATLNALVTAILVVVL